MPARGSFRVYFSLFRSDDLCLQIPRSEKYRLSNKPDSASFVFRSRDFFLISLSGCSQRSTPFQHLASPQRSMRRLPCPAVLKIQQHSSSLHRFARVFLRHRFGAMLLSPRSDLCYVSFRSDDFAASISSALRLILVLCSLRLSTLRCGSFRQFFTSTRR